MKPYLVHLLDNTYKFYIMEDFKAVYGWGVNLIKLSFIIQTRNKLTNDGQRFIEHLQRIEKVDSIKFISLETHNNSFELKNVDSCFLDHNPTEELYYLELEVEEIRKDR